MDINTPQIKNTFQRRDPSRPIIQAILLGIVFVLFSWFLVKPKLADTLKARADLATTQAQLKQTQVDQENLDQLVSKLRSSADDVALVDEALPLNGRVSKANVLIESLVQSSGMALTQMTSDDTAKIISAGDKTSTNDPFQAKRNLHTIAMHVTLTGTMDQFKNFLELVETNGRVLDIDSLDVTGGDQQTKFRLTINAYAYDNSVATSTDISTPQGAIPNAQ